MRILIFTLVKMTSITDSGIYADLVNEFVKRGHHVDYYFPFSSNFHNSGINYSLNSVFLSQKVQKTNNLFLKLITYLYIDYKFSKHIKKFKNYYELLIIATPSIFQSKIVKSFKKKFPNSRTILLLKDIFPDNAIDLGLFRRLPFKRILINNFNLLELRFLRSIDFIGCMNKSNLDYIVSKYPLLKEKLFISPNSSAFSKTESVNINAIDIPKFKKVFLYIGNLGIAQNIISFKRIIQETNDNIFFIVIGAGTQKTLLLELEKKLPTKLLILPESYDASLIESISTKVDAGLILLNPQFKVPNFPSKLLTYIKARIPVIAFTDSYNELKSIINYYSIGQWEDFSNLENCIKVLNEFNFNKYESKFEDLMNLYSIEKQVSSILELLSKENELVSK